jgi:predicted HTH domain antitoxin
MLQVRDLVDARIYRNDQEVLQDALRYLMRGRPDLRVRLAIYRYQSENISLAKAASLAGVSWAQMKEILVAHGIQLRLGPETLEEAEQEVQALRGYFEAQA